MAVQKTLLLIILGAPGAGKGTQAGMISDRFGFPHISTGELFRENIRNHTPLGQQAKSYVEKGQIGPNELVLDMLFERISRQDCIKGCILDGFPRNLSQVEALEAYLKKCPAEVAIISLEVPDETLVERLFGRLVCAACGAPYHKKWNPPRTLDVCDRDGGKLFQRQDDSEAVIKERLKVYHTQTQPVRKYFQEYYPFLAVDGHLNKNQIFSTIDAFIAKKIVNPV